MKLSVINRVFSYPPADISRDRKFVTQNVVHPGVRPFVPPEIGKDDFRLMMYNVLQQKLLQCQSLNMYLYTILFKHSTVT